MSDIEAIRQKLQMAEAYNRSSDGDIGGPIIEIMVPVTALQCVLSGDRFPVDPTAYQVLEQQVREQAALIELMRGALAWIITEAVELGLDPIIDKASEVVDLIPAEALKLKQERGK